MDSSRNRSLLLGAATTLASAAGFWFGTGLDPHWWLTWFAPLPVLLLAPRVRPSAVALSAFLAVTIAAGNQWHYVRELIHLPLPVLIVMIGAEAIVFALSVLLFRRLALRGRLVAAMLSVPLVWTTVHFASAAVSPHGTWGDLAYTQMNAPPIIQVAALTGLWGIGFLVMLVPACLAALSVRAASARVRLHTALTGGVLLALAFGYGALRLADDSAAHAVKLGLVSLQHEKPEEASGPAGEVLLARYVTALDKLADAGVRYAVLPEVILRVSEPDVPALREFAQTRAMTVVVGVDLKTSDAPERNASLAFGPQGGAATVYAKQHLVPFLEDRFTPGSGSTLLAGSKVGLTICKDNDFPALGRAYGSRDTQLLLVPAWDFMLDDWLHSRMAILRGVESGFAIARTARSGRLTLSDDRGRVLAEASSVDGDAQLIGELPLRETRTVYAQFGDWFAWLCVAGLALVVLRAMQGPVGLSPDHRATTPEVS
jgi:apolipoprotein N-acyltransferase